MSSVRQILAECPKCGVNSLGSPLKSGRHVCRACGWVGKLENEIISTEKHAKLPAEEKSVDEISLETDEDLKKEVKIPVSISEVESGPTVIFSDGSQKALIGNGNKLKLQVFTWNWRINQKVSENHYTTFGLNFEELKAGDVFKEEYFNKILGIGADEFNSSNLRFELKKFLAREIQRYFKDACKESLSVLTPPARGLRITTKKEVEKIGTRSDILAACIVGTLFLLFFLSGGATESESESADCSQYMEKIESYGTADRVPAHAVLRAAECKGLID